MLVDDLEHSSRLKMLEPRPTQIFVGLAALVLIVRLRACVEALRENAPLDRLVQGRGLALLQLLHLVEALDEDQVGDLLDHLERIGEAARPEVVPNVINLVSQLARQHRCLPADRKALLGRAARLINATRNVRADHWPGLSWRGCEHSEELAHSLTMFLFCSNPNLSRLT